MHWIIVIFIICIYARYIEPYFLFTPVIRRKFKHLPEELDGLKIAHISDIHGRIDRKGYPLLDRINKISPDYVLITGDFVEKEEEVERVTQGVSKIAENFKVFYVLGNNDFPEWRNKFITKMDEAQAHLLLDDNATMAIGKSNLSFIGINDPVYSEYDLEKAMDGINQSNNDNDFMVLLSHSPDVLDKASEKGINLVIAGHTHGGQIFSNLFTTLYHSFGSFWIGYVSGWLKHGETLCFISRGIGCSRIKVRFLSPPEMPIIELRKDSS